VINP
jgi:hypothetical protein